MRDWLRWRNISKTFSNFNTVQNCACAKLVQFFFLLFIFCASIPHMTNLKDIQKIKKLALEIDHHVAFDGKSLGNKHLSRVVEISLFLCEKLKADKDVVEVAAYLHDVALPTEKDDDYITNKKLIKEIFSDSGTTFGQTFISRVAEAVASHEGTMLPKTLEAKIIHDADVIEKTGLLGIIRHTWKLTNQGKIDPKNIRDKDIALITEHIKWRQSILQTELAKKISAKSNRSMSVNTLRKIIPIISQLASEGIITEKIAKRIEPLLNERQIKSLVNQLTLAYLK